VENTGALLPESDSKTALCKLRVFTNRATDKSLLKSLE
jgi:hypothetical protein